MAKFWGGVFVLAIIAVGFLAAESAARNSSITFTDLETECRYDRGQDVEINLRNNRLYFNGHFPVNNPNANLNYRYRQGDKIVLNVKSSRTSVPSPFFNDCLGSAIYKAHTSDLKPGDYTVIVKHNGKEVEKQVIDVH